MTYACCGLLLLANLILLIRIFWLEQKAFLMTMIVIQVIGNCFGLCVAFLVERLFFIANDLKTLLQTPIKELERLEHSAAWSVAIFFTTFAFFW